MMKYIVLYLIIINVIALLAIAHDKSAARNGQERVRESSLFMLTFLGGGAGMYFAMYLFHHKTRKKRFTIGVPLIFLVEAAALAAWFLKIF